MGAEATLGAPALRLWIVIAACLLAVALGESHGWGSSNGGPHGRGDHAGPDNKRGPGPHGWNGHDPHNGHDEPPPECTMSDSHMALEATTVYINCTALEYPDFIALVQADLGLMEGAALCFAAKVDEAEHKTPPNKDGEVDIDLDEIFDGCVSQVANLDGTRPTEATAEFLKKMIGPESKICSCLPAYVEKMPLCEHWKRFHQFGIRLDGMCESIETVSGDALRGHGKDDKDGNDAEALVVEEEKKETKDNADGEPSVQTEDEKVPRKEAQSAEGAGKHENGHAGVDSEEEHPPNFPNQTPPCPPGQVQHPTDPTQCQPPSASEDELYREDMGHRGPPSQGGAFGLGFSILGVVVIGSLVGIGGVWLWGKFQSGTRQPGVRYMATGPDNDMGTELGPFGREYA